MSVWIPLHLWERNEGNTGSSQPSYWERGNKEKKTKPPIALRKRKESSSWVRIAKGFPPCSKRRQKGKGIPSLHWERTEGKGIPFVAFILWALINLECFVLLLTSKQFCTSSKTCFLWAEESQSWNTHGMYGFMSLLSCGQMQSITFKYNLKRVLVALASGLERFLLQLKICFSMI